MGCDVFDILYIIINFKWLVIVERYINDCEKWFKILFIVLCYFFYIMYIESESKMKGK